MNFQVMVLIQRVFNISSGEWRQMFSSFLYFFFLMSGYFMLRPIRDEMGIKAGVDNMQWLFTGTFLVMVLIIPAFGFLMQRVPRYRLLPRIYLFFTGNIILFYFFFQWISSNFLSAAFFIWLSVFNLFVISIFWSFNADIFNSEQAKRLYGPIAAGGSSGAIFGPLMATLLVNFIGVLNLLLVSAGMLLVATYFLKELIRKSGRTNDNELKANTQTSIWQGLLLLWRSPFLKQIGLFILFYTSISTFLYFEQAHIISNAFTSSIDRTTYFGTRDLLVNSFTLLLQFFLAERIIRKVGITVALIVVPSIAILGFGALGIHQSVVVLLIIQILYRSLNFSIQRPAREMLFTRLTVHEKYNSKNFIDTVIYRGGDALSGWLFATLNAIISSLQVISFLAIPIAMGWLWSALKIGKMFNSVSLKISKNENQTNITKKSA